MRIARLLTAVGLVWALALGFSVSPKAQGQMSDDDFDKLMKSVGQTSGSIRKNTEGAMMDGVAADATKMAGLMKDNMTFWTQRKNQEAADWAKSAMDHATALAKSATAKDAAGVAEHSKGLGGTCQTCHMKNRDKAADGTYMIKKS